MSLYLATCQDCTPVLPQPFTDFRERAEWAGAHRAGTGHTVTYSTGQRYLADREAAGAGYSGSVPVPVLVALAGAWEDQADTVKAESAPNFIAGQRVALSRCARQLREAITKGSAG